ncbi:MAG: HEAT repeat domain-containing protein [Planctomycetes bacterium]|nr:HEAT repeat domain-containing protein [Planctomycetota bacterium]
MKRVLFLVAATALAPASARGQDTVGTLVARALEAPAAERAAALGRLGLLRAEEGLEALKKALGDADLDVRLAAIQALGRFAREDLAPILAAQARDPDPRIAGDAVRALEKTGFAAVPALVDALRHPEAAVAESALEALRRATGVRTRADVYAEAAKSARGDRFAFCREVLARDAGPRAAGDVVRTLPNDPRSAPLLVAALDSEFEPVRDLAVKRLEGLACRRLDAAGWRAWIARAPEGPVVAWRAAALADASNPIRLAAARGLAVPDAAAARALAECAAGGALEEEILRALPAATGLRPRPRADWSAWWEGNRGRSRLEWLLAALLDPADAQDRAAAARSLARERDRRSPEYLVVYGLHDRDAVVRECAAASLAALSGARREGAAAWEAWWRESRDSWK